MPRNSQGVYTPPTPQNPVYPGTLIEADWANSTIGDVGDALTESVTRDGSGHMTGQLTLNGLPPTASAHAVSKAYVDQFVAYASGLPIGAFVEFASGNDPWASISPRPFFLCNGQAISRTTYPDLFALIGTTYGAGDGATTFNVPNRQGWFARGRDSSRTVGSTQAGALGTHTHGLNDPGHFHGVTDPQHSHAGIAHIHTASSTQPTHTHNYNKTTAGAGGISTGSNANSGVVDATSAVAPTITTVVDPTAAGTELASTNVSVNTATTGATVAAEGSTETRPQNIAFDYYIKALQDSTVPVGVSSIGTSDAQMIAIDSTSASVPVLSIKSNVANGIPKLDATAKIPPAQMPFSALNYQGPWDASTGQTPSQTYPTTTFVDGDMYQVAVQGTLTVYQANGVLGPVVCGVGSQITYMTNSPTLPVPGWYYNPPLTLGAVGASQVSFIPYPAGGIAANNVQTAIEEVAAERVPLNGTGATGTWGIGISGNAATATLATNATNATNATTAGTCTGNSATATTAAACSGNSATATTAANCSGNSATASVAGYSKQIPVTANAANMTAAMAGTCVDLTAGMTITNAVMAAGDAVSLYNDTAAPITITQGGSMVLRVNGVATGANRTIAAYSMATVWFKDAATAVMTGAVT